MTDRPIYRVDLQPLVAAGPAEILLRQLLKRALRSYGLRCVRVEELSGERDFGDGEGI